MQENFNQVKMLIDKSHNILLTMHERMDGDDGGSVLAMYEILKSKNKQVGICIKYGVPDNLKFLPYSKEIRSDFVDTNFDLLITFGCSNLNRIGIPEIQNLTRQTDTKQKIKIINIDHHPDNELFGDVNLVDINKSSVAELVYDLFKIHKWNISKNIAVCLLTGIITDTGSFKHSNTQSETLKSASELMKKGVTIKNIISNIFLEKDNITLKVWGEALSKLKYQKTTKVIYSILNEDSEINLSKIPNGNLDGITEKLNTFPEARFAMFLRQDKDIIKGSLRTDPYKKTDVSRIAKFFGGGGHKMASGFSVKGILKKDQKGHWKII